jgi:hypothetical protein
MMETKQHANGIYFRLEKQDWRGDTKAFLAAVKKLKTAVYNPVELDEDNWWFVGKPDVQAVKAIYDKLIGQPLADLARDKASGFKPIPRPWKKNA